MLIARTASPIFALSLLLAVDVASAVAGEVVYEIWRSSTTNLASAVRFGELFRERHCVDVPPTDGQTNYYWIRAVEMQEAWTRLTIIPFPFWHSTATTALRLEAPTRVKRGQVSPLGIRLTIASQYPEYYLRLKHVTFEVNERFGVDLPRLVIPWIDPLGIGLPPSYSYDYVHWDDISFWEAGTMAQINLRATLEYDWETGGPANEWRSLLTDGLNVEISDTFPPAPALLAVRTDEGVYLTWSPASYCTEFSSQAVPMGSAWRLTLMANPDEGGTVVGADYYANGSNAVVASTAAPGYRFGWWSEDGVPISSLPEMPLVMNTNRTVMANFVKTWQLQVCTDPSLGGSVSGGGSYDEGTQAVITAHAATNGWFFDEWVGDGVSDTTSATTTVDMTANRVITAHFVGRCLLDVVGLPAGGGSVIGSGTYDQGATVPIVATPADGYRFGWWAGAGVADTRSPTTTVRLTGHRLVRAQFISIADTGTTEYYVDTDPGFGNGIRVEDAFVVDTSGLALGMHTLFVRGLDAHTGEWGPSFALPFVKELPATESDRTEWFLDTDPGEGNGEDLPANVGIDSRGSVLIAVNVEDLGLHTLWVRSRNTEGVWGTAFGLPFLKELSLGDRGVDAVEFFIDHDPGEGEGARFDVPVESGVVRDPAFDVGCLAGGGHTLFVRGREGGGVWAPVFALPFSHEPDCMVEGSETVKGVRYSLMSNDVQLGSSVDLTNFQAFPDVSICFTASLAGVTGFTNYVLQVQGLDRQGIAGMARTHTFAVSAFLENPAYELWKTNVFTFQQLQNPDSCGYGADPDGDGVPNIAEFALGSHPMVQESIYMPQGELSDGYLQISFRQRKGGIGVVGSTYEVDGIRYTIEVTDQLNPADWQTGASIIEQFGLAVDNGDGTETVIVRYRLPIADLRRKFMRLKLTVL